MKRGAEDDLPCEPKHPRLNEWHVIDLHGNKVVIKVPNDVTKLHIRGPGVAVWLQQEENIITHLFVENVTFKKKPECFLNVTHALLINSSQTGLGRSDNWIYRKTFPSLKYLAADGCAPEIANQCCLAYPNVFKDLREVHLIEDPYGFNLNFHPRVPTYLHFIVSRRSEGLGAQTLAFTGTPTGWAVKITLALHETASLGGTFQLFSGFIESRPYTQKEETESWNEFTSQERDYLTHVSGLPWFSADSKQDEPVHIVVPDNWTKLAALIEDVKIVSAEKEMSVEGGYATNLVFKAAFELCGAYKFYRFHDYTKNWKSHQGMGNLSWSNISLQEMRQTMMTTFIQACK